jgi:hypothetical protein
LTRRKFLKRKIEMFPAKFVSGGLAGQLPPGVYPARACASDTEKRRDPAQPAVPTTGHSRRSTWHETEKDDSSATGDFPFDHPPPPRRQTRQPPAPAQDDNDNYNDVSAYHNKETKDNINDDDR